MAKKKNSKKNKNKKNNSPAVAPKAKFSASETKNKNSAKSEKTTKAKKKAVTATKKEVAVVKQNTKKKFVLIATIATVAAIVIAGAVLIAVKVSNRIPELAISEYLGQDMSASFVTDITIDENTQLERYEEIRKKIKGDKKSFKFYARPDIEIDEKYLEGEIYFSNLAVNDCVMIVTIMDEEDSIIFRSQGIVPGKCMQRFRINKTLPFGENEVRMYVTGYNKDTFEVIGTQFMDLKLVVGSEYNASEDMGTTELTTVGPSVTRPVEATKATQKTRATTTQPETTNNTTANSSTTKNNPLQ